MVELANTSKFLFREEMLRMLFDLKYSESLQTRNNSISSSKILRKNLIIGFSFCQIISLNEDTLYQRKGCESSVFKLF